MKLAIAAVLVACLVSPVVSSAVEPAPQQPVNALWNDDNGLGIWIYPGPGNCPEVRSRLTSFVVVGVGDKFADGQVRQFKPEQLKLCAQWTDKRASAICQQGSLRLEYHAASREYRGSYDLRMSDGKTVTGTFRAQHCAYGM